VDNCTRLLTLSHGSITNNSLRGTRLANMLQLKVGCECASTTVVFHMSLNVMNIGADGLLISVTYNHMAQHTLQMHVCMAVSPSPALPSATAAAGQNCI